MTAEYTLYFDDRIQVRVPASEYHYIESRIQEGAMADGPAIRAFLVELDSLGVRDARMKIVLVRNRRPDGSMRASALRAAEAQA